MNYIDIFCPGAGETALKATPHHLIRAGQIVVDARGGSAASQGGL
jgi:hypothetical protein